MKEVFISYASEQSNVAQKISALLESNGVSAFVAENDIRAGKEYAEELINAIDAAKVMVLIMSKEANASQHVLREVERAVNRNVPIIVYSYEDVILSKSLEYFLMTHQWLHRDQDSENKLISGVMSFVKAESDNELQADLHSDKLVNEVVADITSENNTTEGKDKKQTKKSIITALEILAIIIAALIIIVVNVKKEKVKPVVSYELGTTFTMGTYNDEPIVWRLIHINEDGTGVIVARDVLTFKGFDSAECGTHNELNGIDYWNYENTFVTDPELLIQIRGNNEWAQSNLRTWLNSDKEMVSYLDQAPTRLACVLKQNAYSEEPGFLYYFTEEEKAALVVTERKTKGNALSVTDDEGYVTSNEAVFLLSADELVWFDEAGISMYAKPTAKAIEKDETGDAKSTMSTYKTETCDWWLRDPGWDYDIAKFVEDPALAGGFASANIGTIACADFRSTKTYTNRSCSVCVSVYGTRPAMTVDLSKMPQPQ